MISAEVICDSISDHGKRLTTFKLRYPKFIHGEFMTHRVISRNASSSRAVPTAKLLEEVRSDALRAGPVFWGANQKGMQAAQELDAPFKGVAQRLWSDAAYEVAKHAEKMLDLGVHKQIVNRLLEPFSHINVIASATEWDNFFGLRLDKAAQPEMRALAIAMWEVQKASTPRLLKPYEWHLPFYNDESDGTAIALHLDYRLSDALHLDAAIKVSVARCARVSYESFETGKRSIVEEDLKLYDRLLGSQPLHASPAEHQATPDIWVNPDKDYPCNNEGWQRQNEHGNFSGWRQYRKMLQNEAVAPLPAEFTEA